MDRSKDRALLRIPFMGERARVNKWRCGIFARLRRYDGVNECHHHHHRDERASVIRIASFKYSVRKE